MQSGDQQLWHLFWKLLVGSGATQHKFSLCQYPLQHVTIVNINISPHILLSVCRQDASTAARKNISDCAQLGKDLPILIGSILECLMLIHTYITHCYPHPFVIHACNFILLMCVFHVCVAYYIRTSTLPPRFPLLITIYHYLLWSYSPWIFNKHCHKLVHRNDSRSCTQPFLIDYIICQLHDSDQIFTYHLKYIWCISI